MKCYFLFFILFFFQTKLSAQEDHVIYKPIFINSCSGDTCYSSWEAQWHVLSSTGVIINPTNGSVKLKKDSTYFFVGNIIPEENFLLDLKDSLQIDTFFLSKLKRYFKRHGGGIGAYGECKSYLNGRFVEYYAKGKIHYYGNFEKGKIKDTFISYNFNGQITSENYIAGKHKNSKSYYLDGSLMYDFDSESKYSFSYYPNGSLKNKEKLKGIKDICYYPNGKIESFESSRKIYSLNEKEVYNEKLIYRNVMLNRLFKIWMNAEYQQFDSLGNVTLKLKMKTKYRMNLNDLKMHLTTKRYSLLIRKFKIYDKGEKTMEIIPKYGKEKIRRISTFKIKQFKGKKCFKTEEINTFPKTSLPVVLQEILLPF